MAIAYKILGQSAPSDTNNADLYTVPSLKSTVVSTIAIANVTGTAATYRIFVRQNGAVAALSNAFAYDVSAAANTTTTITIGMTLAAGDVISVRSSVSNALTFHAFGSEM